MSTYKHAIFKIIDNSMTWPILSVIILQEFSYARIGHYAQVETIVPLVLHS